MNISQTNFIVSGSSIFWNSNLSECLVPFPLLKLKYEKELTANFSKIEYCEHTRKNILDLKNDSDYVHLKYIKYLKIFSTRLNTIQNKNYSTFFWSKALSLGLLRQIVILYDHFKTYEMFFDKKKHFVNILSSESFKIPINFDESRNMISDDLLGSEQVFSIYMNLFFTSNINKVISIKKKKEKRKNQLIKYILFFKRLFIKGRKSRVKIGILGSYFEKKNKAKLIISSQRQINEIFLYPIDSKKIVNNHMRDSISRKDFNFDRFDKFFFQAQKYFFPFFFLENFSINEKYILKELNPYRNLRIIISENWTIDSQSSLTLALAKEKYGINHLNNEHNCFSHIYEGRFLEYIINLSDCFYNIGWGKSNNRKIIKSSSLFNFNIKKKKIKYSILFVSAPIQYKMKYFSCFEVFTQENAISTINFNSLFFDSLDEDVLERIFYKKYPTNFFEEKEKFYPKSFDRVKVFSKLKRAMPWFNSLNLIARSKLVIVDYLSTAYLESLISDIPTIVFFDESVMILNKKHKIFFKTLINSGIFQTHPIEASKLVKKIHHNPQKWWNSQKVKKSRDTFLQKNIGKPEIFINQILDKLKEK